jgi:hypothetical protein
MVSDSGKTAFKREIKVVFNDILKLQDITDSEESTKHLHFPLKIEWPARKNFGFDDDDSDERPDSGVGESVNKFDFTSTKTFH